MSDGSTSSTRQEGDHGDRWIDRLSEYVDGGLPRAERRALEAHLTRCRRCAKALDELRRVAARARSLPDRPPARDLWPELVARIRGVAQPTRGARVLRVTLTVPQLLAAGVALMLVSGGTAWWIGRDAAPRELPREEARPPFVPVALPGREYERAVADLERVLEQGHGLLDTTTVRILEENLRAIDVAIEQARRAVAADPANAYLTQHLADNMKRKLQLLRRASDIVSARS